MPRQPIAIAAAGGLLTGLLVLLALQQPALLPLRLFAQLPLFAVGLGLGFTPAVVAGAVASGATLFFNVVTGISFALVYVLPVALVVRFALLNRTAADGSVDWYPLGRLLAMLTVYAAAMLLAALVLFAGEDGGLEGVLHRLIVAILAELEQQGVLVPAGQDLQGDLKGYLFLVPGSVGAYWIVSMIVNAAIGQKLLQMYGRNIRPKPAYVSTRLPEWLAYSLALSAGAWFLGGDQLRFAAGGLFVVLATPFFLQGLAVAHRFVRRWSGPGRIAALVAFYGVLVVMSWSIVLVAALGVFEQWFDFRGRMASA